MFSVLAIIVYSLVWTILLKDIKEGRPTNSRRQLLPAIAAGLALHGAAVYCVFVSDEGLRFGVLQIATLFFWVILCVVTASCTRKPLQNLYLFLLPLAAIAILFASVFSKTSNVQHDLGGEMITHILLSILAYSLLTIASFQALLLAYQNNQLRAKHPGTVMGLMPPLQTVEALLFEILWAGFILLTLSIVTGVIFIENMLAQNLSHKTVFSILSWLIYATLLGGHVIRGWRGAAAIRWTLCGFAALMLAYFGSKIVLEFLLASA